MFAIYDETGKMIDYVFDQDGIDKLLELYKEEIEEERFTFNYDAPQRAVHVRDHILENYRSLFRNVNSKMEVEFNISEAHVFVRINGVLNYCRLKDDFLLCPWDYRSFILGDIHFPNVDEWELVE